MDLETTGIPGSSTTHEIVTIGYLNSTGITVVQRTSKSKEEFYQSALEIVDNLPRPFYAYNSGFDRRILEVELGVRFTDEEFLDLMAPWKFKCSADGRKWPSLDELISEPEAYYGEARISGSQVPAIWNSYTNGNSPRDVLKLIADHCHSDLLRELYLLLRYPFNKSCTATPVSLLQVPNNGGWVLV